MRVVKDTPLEFAFRTWQLRPPQPSMVCVVKGTFDYPERRGAPAVFAQEQLLPSGESFAEDEIERCQIVPSDMALLKPCAEALVVGSAWAPGAATGTLACSFRVGPVERRFVVFGDRVWQGLIKKPTEPIPFGSMPLSMDRAYGGAGHAPNPWGRGREMEELADGTSARCLPNVESMAQLISSPGDAPRPLVVGPVSPVHESRVALVGTYGDAYMKRRWPYLAEDFQWEYYLEAQPEQRLRSGYFRGDEPVVLQHLDRARPMIEAALPGVRPRLYLDVGAEGAPRLRSVRLSLDTVVLQTDLGKLLLTWRGVIDVPSEGLEEVRHVFLSHEPLAAPEAPDEAMRARFVALLAAEAADDEELEGEPPDDDLDDKATLFMTSDSVPTVPLVPPTEEQVAAYDAGEAAPVDEEAQAVDAKVAALDALLARAGIAPPPAEGEPPPPAKDLKERIAQLTEQSEHLPEPVRAALAGLAEALEQDDEREDDDAPTLEGEAEPLTGRAMIEAMLARGESLVGVDASEADLSGLDLSGQDLTDAFFSQASLAGALLAGAKLDGASLDEAELVSANLEGASLVGANLAGANADRCRLVRAVLDDADLDDARLSHAALDGATLLRASMMRVKLEGASLGGADLSEADLEDADLRRADLRQARLVATSLQGAVAEGAVFDDADLTNLRAEGLRAKEVPFRRVRADDSFWEKAELSQADFGMSDLRRADFSDAVLIGTSFDGCVMRESRLDRANAHSMHAIKADFFEAGFDSATLSFADLRGANLFGAELHRAALDHAQLELANLGRTKAER